MEQAKALVDVQRVLVGVRQAQRWLDKNIENNRKQRPLLISRYARDMLHGAWQETGHTLKVTPDGRLLDGQHQCQAVVEAGQTDPNIIVPMWVAFNVDPSAMTVIDTGAGRTFADVLQIQRNNVPSRNVTGAVTRWVFMYEKANYTGRRAPSSLTYPTPTNTELLARFDQNPMEFGSAALRAEDARIHVGSLSSAFGTGYYILHDIHEEWCKQYADMLISGAGLPDGHPALTTRNRLLRNKMLKRERLSGPEQLAIVFRGWNAWREERSLDRVVISYAGPLTNENFPLPVEK